MNGHARISYLLSEEGRKDSLRNGGDGKRQQVQHGELTRPEDLDCFDVDNEGQVSFDATDAPQGMEEGGTYSFQAVVNSARDLVLWNVVPTWDDLLHFVRRAHQTQSDIYNEDYLDWQASEAQKATIAAAFLADPTARAEKLPGSGNDRRTFSAPRISLRPIVTEAQAQGEARCRASKKPTAKRSLWTRSSERSTNNSDLRRACLPWKEVIGSTGTSLSAARLVPDIRAVCC
jgi:hypothetical protein